MTVVRADVPYVELPDYLYHPTFTPLIVLGVVIALAGIVFFAWFVFAGADRWLPDAAPRRRMLAAGGAGLVMLVCLAGGYGLRLLQLEMWDGEEQDRRDQVAQMSAPVIDAIEEQYGVRLEGAALPQSPDETDRVDVILPDGTQSPLDCVIAVVDLTYQLQCEESYDQWVELPR